MKPLLLGLLVLASVPGRSAAAAEDPERQIQEHFRQGEADWKKSCAKPSEDGACVRVAPSAAGRARCGSGAPSDITVIARDKKRAASAKQHFEAVVKLSKEGAQQNYAEPTAAAVAGARFYLAEEQYENFLRKTAPTDLDFSQPSDDATAKKADAVRAKSQDSQKRFAAYLDEKSKAVTSTRDAYLEAFKVRRAPWNIAAAARVGQTYQGFAEQLRTLSIPKDLASKEDVRKVYCTTLDEKAEPIARKAIEAFEMCIKTANESDAKGSWSELCERELARLKPVSGN